MSYHDGYLTNSKLSTKELYDEAKRKADTYFDLAIEALEITNDIKLTFTPMYVGTPDQIHNHYCSKIKLYSTCFTEIHIGAKALGLFMSDKVEDKLEAEIEVCHELVHLLCKPSLEIGKENYESEAYWTNVERETDAVAKRFAMLVRVTASMKNRKGYCSSCREHTTTLPSCSVCGEVI